MRGGLGSPGRTAAPPIRTAGSEPGWCPAHTHTQQPHDSRQVFGWSQRSIAQPAAWKNAACPACLALGVLKVLIDHLRPVHHAPLPAAPAKHTQKRSSGRPGHTQCCRRGNIAQRRACWGSGQCQVRAHHVCHFANLLPGESGALRALADVLLLHLPRGGHTRLDLAAETAHSRPQGVVRGSSGRLGAWRLQMFWPLNAAGLRDLGRHCGHQETHSRSRSRPLWAL